MTEVLAPGHRSALLALFERVGGPLLAIDTSCPTASVFAVGWSSDGIDELMLGESAKPSAALAARLESAFREHKLAPSDLKALVIGTGPGSFTGLRVGLSVAKGLALGAQVPLYGISSLALWSGAAGPGLVRPILDARRGQFFTSLYRVNDAGEALCVEPDSLVSTDVLVERIQSSPSGEGVTLTGDGVGLLELPSSGNWQVIESLPQAHIGLLTLHERVASGDSDEAGALVPNYLQITEAERQALLRRQ